MISFVVLSMTTGPVAWGDIGSDWIGFLGLFALVGAIGFRALVVARAMAWERSEPDSKLRMAVLRAASRNAAIVGALGTGVMVLSLVARFATQGGVQGSASTLWIIGGALVLALLGFILVWASVDRPNVVAWTLAGLGVAWVALGDAVTALVHGRWAGVLNPIHSTGAALWLGTLLVMVVAGFPAVLVQTTVPSSRGPLVANLVNAFSPVALWSAALVGLTGVLTAWRHLKSLAALWTTAYGLALVMKLCLVAVVVGLGAWNWRRVRPMLGDEPAAYVIRRSATAELGFAALVLVVTAVLINLPTPKLPPPHMP